MRAAPGEDARGRRCGTGAQPLREEDGTALAGGLLSAMAASAALPGSHLLVLHAVDDAAPNGTGLQWCRAAMNDAGEQPAL
ncbi:hypothetical protein [Streptomyces lavenduligriseus]|uniref:Uncharacterized protein n=1 Tax=Streptomyces lavenduligriseus TaxID=67315 RepID=A0ABT0P5X8_9ACTN|nr:hypothetical protein [Streptomyces lavenduligriseus]MCL3998786.1 hypothetical protein [Streptomyces lavenduligriseus]